MANIIIKSEERIEREKQTLRDYGINPERASSAQKELAEAGYIEKHPAEKDGRVVHISLSRKGKETVGKYVKDYFRTVSEKLSDLSDEEIEQMNETITSIYDHLVTGKEGKSHE